MVMLELMTLESSFDCYAKGQFKIDEEEKERKLKKASQRYSPVLTNILELIIKKQKTIYVSG